MRHSFDTVVIGGGIFGKVISRALARRGHDVQLIDNHNTLRGSDPAACLMKPSWLSKLGKELEPSLLLLDELYGIKNLLFKMGPAYTTVHWVDPDYILYPSVDTGVHHSNGTVEHGVDRHADGYTVFWRDQDEWEERESRCKNVVVAAGIWSSTLVPQLKGKLDGRWGVSVRVPGQIDPNIILPWAPFKQLVAFNINDDEVWVGDGSAWKDHPTDERIAASVNRSLSIFADKPAEGEFKTYIGVRPYAKTGGDPCLLQEIGPDYWVATAGAKNGTAAAAWAARRLIERLT